jgi:hypothetical protein
MEGLKNEVVCKNTTIRTHLPFQTLGYREAIIRAMNREEQDQVHTRWSDAYPPAHELALKFHELEAGARYTGTYSLTSTREASALFAAICRVGGKEGWFSNNLLWRMRGAIDKMLLGVGTSRGRKSHSSLKINDVIDFWRVEDLQKDRRLLLRSEMKMPGKAWLEFTVQDNGSERLLTIVAHYHPEGYLGSLYWYIFLPFHDILFNNLLGQIESRSRL